uniref:Uncharacterized protein n=1 Tax=Knipowitschia caucasica TaxID=637954 RepID=A0AAV2KBA4_KNICA
MFFAGARSRPSNLSDFPDYLLRVQALLPRKRRRRGVRSGRRVRLKSWLVLSPELLRFPVNIPRDSEACCRRFLSPRQPAPLTVA